MRYKIPVTAIKVREIRGILKEGEEHAGKELVVSIYEGEASQGAQTGFQRVPHLWIKIAGDGWAKPVFKRFSGKNIAVAMESLKTLQSHLEEGEK